MRKPTAIRTAAVAVALTLILAAGQANAAGENAAAKVQEASSALLRGNIEQAVTAYTDALQDASLANDRRAAILNDRGVASSRLGRHKAALDDYNRAVQLFPEYAPVYNNRGNTLLQLGLAQEALKDFDRAIALAPGYAPAYNNRAGALIQLGKTEQAIRDYTSAITLMPQSVAPLTGRGRALLEENRPYAALRDFSRAVSADSRSAAAYRARARAAMAVDRIEEAIEDLSRAIAFEPDSAELYIERGHAYRFTDNAAALRDFTKAIELDGQNARALAGRGLSLAKAEAYEEAEAEFAKALEIDPRCLEAYAYRAWAYKQAGQPEIGIKEIEKALRTDVQNADVYWAKGEVEQALGRTEAAIASFRKALALMPSHRDASAALQQMDVPPDTKNELPAAGIPGWRVVAENGRYAAYLEGKSKLRVPLEMAGAGEPRLLQWELKDGALKGIGLLRYRAGTAQGQDGPEPIEQVAIVDVPASRVISLQLHRQGDRESTWTWNEGTVTVESIDGVTDLIVLRDQRRREVAERRPVEDRNALGGPSWAPWNQIMGPPTQVHRGQPQRRARPPKTIFDLLFGN